MANSNLITSNENWKPIPDFPGYEVSNLGRVRSFWKKSAITDGRGYIEGISFISDEPHLIMGSCQHGYPQVTLMKDKKESTQKIHKLVLLAFVGPRPLGYECRHLDGNRGNNRLDNLVWGTRRENTIDRARHGNDLIGERHPNVKLTEKQVIRIREIASTTKLTQSQIAINYGVRRAAISKILTGRTWKHLP